LATGNFGGPALYLPFALTGTLDPRITFSRPSLATMYDSTGKLVYAPNNLVLQSNTFTNASWTKSNATLTFGVSDPDGGMNATTLTATSGNGEIFQSVGLTAGANALTAIWIRRRTGTGTVSLRKPDISSNVITLTSSWQKFYVSAVSGGTARGCNVLISTSGDEVDIYQGQLEAVTYQTTPSTYNATTSAAYYGPRFDYNPATLVARGLLIEESRTNLVSYSQQINAGGSWTLTAIGVPTTTTSPDGTSNAYVMVPTAAAAAHFFFKNITVTAAAHTWSICVKANGYNFITLNALDPSGPTDNRTWFNLGTGAVATNAAGNTASIVSIGNGWYRCSVTRTVSAGSSAFEVVVSDADNTISFTGNGTSGVYAFGAQLEAGAFATSYIPTAATTVARSGDSVTMTGTNFSSWYNQAQGTFVVAADVFGAIGGELPTFVNVNDTTTSNYIRLNAASTYRLRQFINVGGSQQTQDVTGSAPVLNQQFKVGAAYNLNDFAVVADGGAVSTDATGTVPTVTQINFGVWFGSAGTVLNGHIAAITYYTTRLPNATLQSLTT
jgi:hypothetical protein